MRSILTALVFVAATSMVAQAQVSGEIRDGLIVVIAETPIEAAGLDFQSAGGNLVPVPDPPGSMPFTFFLSNTANQITWGNLGSTVTIDGELATQAGYTGDPTGDLTTFWGDGPTPVEFTTTLPGGGDPDPPVVEPPPVVDPPVVDPPAASGPVSGSINADGFIVVNANPPVEAAGLDFQSAAGLLVPVAGDDATPFTFFLSNTANQITWGNLGSTVTIDGDLVTGAGYTGDPSSGDLQTFWGDGPTPVAFAVSAGAVEPPVVEPPVVDPPVVDPPVVDPPVVDPPVVNPIVPEPTSGLLAVFATLGILGFRKRRS